MKRLVLGVVGHVDHGKTALVGALTGIDTDRLPEEKRRGISIALGFAHAEIGGGQVDFVDAPGHERFVRTLVGGVTGADAVLLVVAANEGLKPQTREHLTIAALLGLRSAIVAVSKTDLVTPERAGAVGQAAAGLARELGLRARPPIATSAISGLGLDDLRAAIADELNDAPAPPQDGFAYLPVDRAFLVPGQGVVVTGTLRRGALRPEDALVLWPAGAPVRVRRLQVHGRPVDRAEPGQRTAVNLRGAELEQTPRGVALAGPAALSPSEWLTVTLRAAPDAPPLANGARLDLLTGASATPVTVRLLEGGVLDPGQSAVAQLRARTSLAAPAREGFVLRTAAPSATVAGGAVIDPAARRFRRGDPVVIRRLKALAAASPEERVRLTLEQSGAGGVTRDRLAQLAGLSPAKAEEAARAAAALVLKGGTVVGAAAFARARKATLAVLEQAGEGLPRGGVAARAPGIGAAVLDAVLAALAADGRIRSEGGRFAMVRAAQDSARAAAAAALAERLARALCEGGLSPPDLGAAGCARDQRQALETLVRRGVAIRTLDRVQKREILFHASAVESARRLLAGRLAPPGLSVGEAGRVLGVSRKYSVPLLEHLDAIGFTRRRGDRRVLAEALRSVSREGDGGD